MDPLCPVSFMVGWESDEVRIVVSSSGVADGGAAAEGV